MHFDQINRFEMNCIFKNLLRIDHFVRRWFQSRQDYIAIEYFWMNFLGLDLSGTILQQLKWNHRHLVLTCFRLNDLFDWSWNQLWNLYLPWKYKSCNFEIFQGSKFSFLTFGPYFAEWMTKQLWYQSVPSRFLSVACHYHLIFFRIRPFHRHSG